MVAIDRHADERIARAHLRRVPQPPPDRYLCVDCPDANGFADPPEPTRWVWTDDDGSVPLCNFHADERIHDAIPYGQNCTRCGIDHSALWPDGELDR